ncbi:GIY-YIG nuclease family protein [Methylobacterium sp. WL103]|uniref:GIY-YIG nuclease family protein n=1 Tax=unclassified Methylobacterium TaxID=2615210 RepID=UPI0011CC246F|nr:MULTISPECIES: GIY-YIG nuclease family protein [unclassified Methylobacterium]TXM72849.1 GIY-YIG nuclease family protein [Methylobacterium sp. WL12]TXM97583.1 GIY-YIG nuclease family protein [Methylobacterium sp. WL103]
MTSHVDILASQRNGTLYTGSTTDLARRVWEHRPAVTPGFTKTYGVVMLVWSEDHPRIIDARIREYAIKRWRRAWKLALIEAMNPDWRDLYLDLNQ